MIFTIIILISLFATCQLEVQILDYTNSQLISVHLGQTRLQNGNFKLIHVLNLTDYEQITHNLNVEINKNSLKSSTNLPFILHDIIQIKNLLERIKPRHKRSINAMGTIWKWIAGTPDHEDHQIVVNKMNGLLTNNERQRIINRDSIERINVLTNTTNQILKTVKSLEQVHKTIEDTIINKLKIIKDELLNIEYALQWARVGVINSFILSENEILEAKTFLDNEKFPYNNLEEALGFASIRIATDESTILYIVNLPVIDKDVCEKILIKPVKKHQTIVKINSEEIIKCNNKFYEIEKNCNQFNDLSICSKNNLLDISETNCIPPLLNSKKHDCIIINNQHVPSVQELSKGMLFLNQFEGFLEISGNKSYQLSGTYIINFHNDTITVENKTFISRELTTLNPLPAVLQLSNINSTTQEVLSLEMMKELQTTNVDELDLISTKGNIMFSLNLVLTAILIFGFFFIFFNLKNKRQNTDLSVTAIINETPDPRNSDFEKSPPVISRREFRSVNDLPVF